MGTTYKKIEVIGTSPESFAKATESAVEKAAQTLRGISWFEVTEMRGQIRDGKIAEYQVAVKLGVKLD